MASMDLMGRIPLMQCTLLDEVETERLLKKNTLKEKTIIEILMSPSKISHELGRLIQHGILHSLSRPSQKELQSRFRKTEISLITAAARQRL